MSNKAFDMKKTYGDEFVEKMKKRLFEEKERLKNELKPLKEEFDETQSEQSGENDYEDDMADVGTTTFIRERDDSLIWNIKDLLNQVNDALYRIEEGTYGYCVECPGGIPKKRLEALPWASSCLTCQVQSEG